MPLSDPAIRSRQIDKNAPELLVKSAKNAGSLKKQSNDHHSVKKIL
jgi:hypothetical protein